MIWVVNLSLRSAARLEAHTRLLSRNKYILKFVLQILLYFSVKLQWEWHSVRWTATILPADVGQCHHAHQPQFYLGRCHSGEWVNVIFFSFAFHRCRHFVGLFYKGKFWNLVEQILVSPLGIEPVLHSEIFSHHALL